jgi:3-hydroxybutyryl-CoA dehydrogenase
MPQKKILVWADDLRIKDILSRNIPSEYAFEFLNDYSILDEISPSSFYFILDEAMVSCFPYEKLGNDAVVFVNEVCKTLSDLPDRKGIIRINAWPGFLRYHLIELSAREDDKKDAEKLLTDLGWSYRWVADVPGLVTPRVIAMIVNEACFALNEKVSSPAEIDIALKLGTSYPLGPFEWSKQVGSDRIIQLLIVLSKDNERYMPAPFIENILQ